VPPPPLPGSKTGEIEILAIHIRTLSDELAAERKARQEEEKHGISILNLRVPFLMVFLIVAPLVGVGVGSTLFVKKSNAHFDDTFIHADRNAVLARGGIAYEKDIDEKVSAVESEREASDRKALRLIVKSSPITCTPIRAGSRISECKLGEPVLRQ
jgi:hypothetical protein